MIQNTISSYGWLTKIFHWLIAIAIFGLIFVGLTMHSMEPSPEKLELYIMHKASGVVVLMLVVARLIWRQINKTVNPPSNLPHILALASKTVHFMLYIFMLLMPISGIMMSLYAGFDVPVFDLFTITAADKNPKIAGIFHQIHTIGIWFFISIIILHIGAALYHHFVRKDNVLIRIIK